jgi:uncharacterized protein YecE (DUF72 family)
MSGSLPLFDEPSKFDRERLAGTLRQLAGEGVLIGTSSWKYEGWIGQVYSAEPYMVRGRFSKKRFEQNCLAEYADTFPIVCGDFSFYQFPTDEFWHKLFATAPSHLRFAFKVPEEVTCRTYPNHPRYGPRAGQLNETFLNVELFYAGFLRALAPWRERIPVLIFEFGTFSKKSYPEPELFFADLDRFLSSLPREWRYAVEIRNEEFLLPAYFEMLRRHGVAHVFNGWTRMPPLHRQVQIAEAYTADFTVVRALLRTGRPYERAVKMFTPYDHIQDPNPPARQAMRQMVERARKRREPAYLFINNRLEGNAPITIDSVVHGDMSPEED